MHFFAFNGMQFLFAAIGVSMVVKAWRGGARHRYPEMGPPPQQTLLEDPRVPRLQAEVDELRAQVDRLAAAESFYAQLSAPAPTPRGGPQA